MRGLAILLVLMLALLAWLQYRLWFGNGGEREVAALQAQVHRQARDNAGLRQRNDALDGVRLNERLANISLSVLLSRKRAVRKEGGHRSSRSKMSQHVLNPGEVCVLDEDVGLVPFAFGVFGGLEDAAGFEFGGGRVGSEDCAAGHRGQEYQAGK